MFVQQIGQIFSVYEAAWAQNRALRNAAVYREIRRLLGSVDKCLGPVGQVRFEPAESRRTDRLAQTGVLDGRRCRKLR